MGAGLLFLAATLLAANPTLDARAADSTITATVVSATTLDLDTTASGCRSATPALSLGLVMPDDKVVTPADCSIMFGSSNDSSMLKVYQADGEGRAMWQTAPGAVDTSYGTAGVARMSGMPSVATTFGADVDSEGRLVTVGEACYPCEGLIQRYDAGGDPDLTFDGDGWNVATVGTPTDIMAFGVSVLPDDRAMMVGKYSDAANGDQILLARYLVNGAADPSLDGDGNADGVIVVDQPGTGEFFRDVELLPDGTFLAAGDQWGSDRRVLLARYRADGTAVNGWGTTGSGYSNFDPNPGVSEITMDMVVQPDGKIVVAGIVNQAGSDEDIFVARFLADGTIDSTGFGVNGARLIPAFNTRIMESSTWSRQVGLGVDAQGRILVGANHHNGTDLDYAVARLTSGGALDTTFNTTGFLNFATAGAGDDVASGLMVQPDGHVLVAGTRSEAGADRVAVARVTPSASLDPTYGSNGVAWGPAMPAEPHSAQDVVTPVQDVDGAVAVTHNATDDQYAGIRFVGDDVVEDWNVGTFDWTNGGNAFGACLETAYDGAQGGVPVNGWPVAGNDGCTDTDSTVWRPVVEESGSAGAKVAAVPGGADGDAKVTMRFGFKAASNQSPGSYVAPLVFEVSAPYVA